MWALATLPIALVIAIVSSAHFTNSPSVQAATHSTSTTTTTAPGTKGETLSGGSSTSTTAPKSATPTPPTTATTSPPTTSKPSAHGSVATPHATAAPASTSTIPAAPTPTSTTTTAKPTSTTTTSTPSSAAANTTPAPATGMTLAFNAGFAGSTLDSSVWDTCYEWYVASVGCTSFNNPETEWYLPSQVQVSDDALHLVADATPTQGTNASGAPETYPYTSGMVTTFSSFDFTYGYVQVVARIPGGTGTWPAIWMLPENGTWPPEIDIMENYGTTNQIETTVHWGTTNQEADQDVTSPTDLTSGWHTYGLLWEPGSLTWYLDGKVVFSYTGVGVPSQPMYLLANLAIDGAAASGSSFDIQSAQIYQAG
jgi:beta-glucanase (GH16 family)